MARSSKLLATLATLALLGACRSDRPAARASMPADSVTLAKARGDSQPSPAATRRATAGADDSIPPGFVVAADSVLQARLAREMFIGNRGRGEPMEECDLMDEGLPPAFAAVSARVLQDVGARPKLHVDPTTGERDLSATVTVAITSVATLQQVAGANLDKRYDVTVAPRIDTAEVYVSRRDPPGSWEVCEPLRYRDGVALEPWSFVQASDTAIRTEKWIPATMNWSALTKLARDSSDAR